MTQLEKVELALRRVLDHQRAYPHDIGVEVLLVRFADALTVVSADEEMCAPSLKDEMTELKTRRKRDGR